MQPELRLRSCAAPPAEAESAPPEAEGGSWRVPELLSAADLSCSVYWPISAIRAVLEALRSDRAARCDLPERLLLLSAILLLSQLPEVPIVLLAESLLPGAATYADAACCFAIFAGCALVLWVLNGCPWPGRDQ
jgi:hypothetical protein